jgi:tRNA pseudouridine32 synthase/23S rRNA pseudouridine746 synthase
MPPKGSLPPLPPHRLQFQVNDVRHIPLTIIHESPEWVIISKPSGLLSVPGTRSNIDDSASQRIQTLYPQAQGGLVVHRLDLSTSGLMIFALTPNALAAFHQLFVKKEVSKHYTAVVSTSPQHAQILADQKEGMIHLPLRLDPFQRPLQIHDSLHGKPCSTQWSYQDQHPLGSLLTLSPITGRTHQLRVHCAHPLGLNSAIVGDRLYHRTSQNQRLHLHASALSFVDPLSQQRFSFEDPAPFL